MLLRAAPEYYPELKELERASERWNRMVAANPALASFLQLLKGRILPQDIAHKTITQEKQENASPS